MANDSISKAFTGKGTVFSIGTAGSTPTYTAVAELKTFAFTGTKNDTEDVTNSDSAGRYREYLVTLADAGEISISGNYVASDTGQIAFSAAFESAARRPFKIQLPLAPGQTTLGDTITFLGYVIGDDLDIQYDKAVTFASKIKITGARTFTTGS
jgi:predicted secreted protein